jgi:hypothetical protein
LHTFAEIGIPSAFTIDLRTKKEVLMKLKAQ